MDLNAPYLSLKTFKKSGAAVLTPVWFVSTNHNQLHVFSSKNAGKIKRIRKSKRVNTSEMSEITNPSKITEAYLRNHQKAKAYAHIP